MPRGPTLVYWTVGVTGVLYIFWPTIRDILYDLNPFALLQDDNMLMLRRRRKVGRYTVGLSNPANDCFANSNLQSLAALPPVYSYLEDLCSVDEEGMSRLSYALKRMVERLNEPVLTPKTLSPWELLRVLESIYNSHISRSQHDAHELLHLILETLETENERLRKRQPDSDQAIPRFCFSGQTADTIACSKCGYVSPANVSPFVVLSLMVPQRRSVALSELIDQQFAPEYIPDYGCVSCRLQHVLRSGPESLRAQVLPYKDDPGSLPDELDRQLPKHVTAPISKRTAFHRLPEVLSLHLSRSIYGGFGASRNSCKVQVQETIDLYEVDPSVGTNSVLDRRRVSYRLMAMIRHKGTHQHGHYECFRRKSLDWWTTTLGGGRPAYIPLPTGYMSAPAPASPAASIDSSTLGEYPYSTPPPPPPPQKPVYPRSQSYQASPLPYPGRSSPSPASVSTSDVTGTTTTPEDTAAAAMRNKANPDVLPPSQYQWWKISDDRVWECSLKDVLKEESGAYLLFYERILYK